MDETKARMILADYIQPDGGLYCLGHYLSWSPRSSVSHITLDDEFTADELEAIVWWMRNKINAAL